MPEEPPPDVVKPNILLIMADDLGYNDLAINNENAAIDTPNMDQLAREGVRFTRHYAAAVCSPARAAMLTGIYPERLGYLPNGRGISPEVVTLPEQLKQAGYTTWHIGKWNIGDLERTAWPDYQGFDHWFGFLNQWRLAGEMIDGEVQLATPRYINPWLESDTEPGRNYPGHLENILTDKAINVLSELNEAQAPWFVNLWYYAPHAPNTPASEFAANYPDTDAGRFRALVNQLDTNIGKVISHLEALDALDNTIIVVVSDNGGTNHYINNNAPYFGVKASLTEGGLRAPLIIRWPEGAVGGETFSDTISIQDIYPTLLASINVTPPANIDGRSFYQSIQKLESAPQATLYWEFGASSFGVLSADGRFRLHKPFPYFGIESELELYDLVLDPTAEQWVVPLPSDQIALMTANYQNWYKDVHTVKTQSMSDMNGSGVLSGMAFLRTPGFGPYTFGIGVSHEFFGRVAGQAGIWEISRSGDTVMAQFGDVILAGTIDNTNACHSVVISGSFRRTVALTPKPELISLTLYIDGVEAQTVERESVLIVDDPMIDTIIGDTNSVLSSGTLFPPVILNVQLDSATPWTVESFAEELCES